VIGPAAVHGRIRPSLPSTRRGTRTYAAGFSKRRTASARTLTTWWRCRTGSPVIDFPGYTVRQLAAIFATLAVEAGFSLTSEGARKAAGVLAPADAGHGSGNARLAVRLLDQATVSQARRITTATQLQDPATLSTIDAADIPGHVHLHDPPADDWPGQYL